MISALDQKLKEPKRLLFFHGGLYESTMNNPTEGYSQSQVLLMLDVPSRQNIESRSPISLMAAPTRRVLLNMNMENFPTADDLETDRWAWVQVRISPEQLVTRGLLWFDTGSTVSGTLVAHQSTSRWYVPKYLIMSSH